MTQNFFLAQAIRAVSHKLRHEMLQFIEDKQAVTVTEVFIAFRIDQAFASQHLAILRRAGLLTTKRDGKFIYYSVDGNALYLLECLEKAWQNREIAEQLIQKRLKKAA
jgi:ArsR family transcriptional regulator, virulence genes transcriptional regulator